MKTAVLAIAAEFERPYWREWAQWYRDLGFDDVWIVTNDWDLDRPVPDYVKSYRRDGKVIQLAVYNEWTARWRWEYDWALVCDLDEFLYLPGTVGEWLGGRSDYCLGVPWVHFGDGGPGTPSEGSVVRRFVRCEGVYNRHVKPAVNLRALSGAQRVFFVNPHFACANDFWLPWTDILGRACKGPYDGFEGAKLDPSLPFFAHYYTKTREEWRRRRGPEHLRADCPQFVTEDWFDRENHNE